MFIGKLNSHLLNIYAIYFGYVKSDTQMMFKYTDDLNQHNTRKINSITLF